MSFVCHLKLGLEMNCLDPVFDFKIGELNTLLQLNFWVSLFNPLTVGHLGWCTAKFEVYFFGGCINEGIVVRLLLGLQNYGSLDILV